MRKAAPRHGLTVAEIELWQEQYSVACKYVACEYALRTHSEDEELAKDEQIERLQKKAAELVLEIDILKERTRATLSTRGRQTSEAVIPEASERCVCRLLGVPRSSMRSAPLEKRPRRPLDAALVERIRELIKRYPTFGYRKL